MIANRKTIAWLKHRAGLLKISGHPYPYCTRALQLNDKGDAFIAAYGKRQIWGFVGFVDLVGFSTKVEGLSPQEICDYLRPFLSGVIDEVSNRPALVDKTIGDEVMFIVPDMEQDGGPPGVLRMSSLLGGLHDLQRNLGIEYPFRIGLSYGALYVDLIKGRGYSEWTVVGESVNLAKRLHTIPEAEPKDGLGGAFGVLVEEVGEEKFKVVLEYIAGFASRMTHRVVEGTVELKGISSARCAILYPKVPFAEWKSQKEMSS